MKKILACAICLVSFVGVNSASAADGTYTGNTATSITMGTNTPAATNPTLVTQLSSNVQMNYDSDATGLNYTIASYHNKGSRTYGSTSNDSKIYYTATTATAPVSIPASGVSGAFNSWIAL